MKENNVEKAFVYCELEKINFSFFLHVCEDGDDDDDDNNDDYD